MTPLGWGAGGAKNRDTPTRAVQKKKKRNNIDAMICQYKQKKEIKVCTTIYCALTKQIVVGKSTWLTLPKILRI